MLLNKILTQSIDSIALTTDLWMAKNNRSFISLTVNFIDSDFKSLAMS